MMSRFARQASRGSLVRGDGQSIEREKEILTARLRDLARLINVHEPTAYPAWMDSWESEMSSSWKGMVSLERLRAGEAALTQWLQELENERFEAQTTTEKGSEPVTDSINRGDTVDVR